MISFYSKIFTIETLNNFLFSLFVKKIVYQMFRINERPRERNGNKIKIKHILYELITANVTFMSIF